MKKFDIKYIGIIGIICLFNLFFLPLEDSNQQERLRPNTIDFSQVNPISDGYNNSYWNNANSRDSSMVIDDDGNIYAVWVDESNGLWGGGIPDTEIMYAFYMEGIGWSNATVISDGYNDYYWNNNFSEAPSIAVDNLGNIHVVWDDSTVGIWGTDAEIMYVNYTQGVGWSNATVISDDITLWNDDNSVQPSIAVDNSGNIHVVWMDNTNGIWGTDAEIMYVNYTQGVGWSSATIISDGYNNFYWNDGLSQEPSITVDSSGTVNVVWVDSTTGVWGGGTLDPEIMYVNYTQGVGWSNATIISDGYNNYYWNDGGSMYPSIIANRSQNIYVVWSDDTEGVWGGGVLDTEIMYVNYTQGVGWSNATVISDGYNNYYWNDGTSIVPDITLNASGSLHVVWSDGTDGVWGTDAEIMCVNFTEGVGWSNVTIISDDETGWNNLDSTNPSIVADSSENIYVIWEDSTFGSWGFDQEIMSIQISYSFLPDPTSNPLINPFIIIVISIFILSCIALLLFLESNTKKRKQKLSKKILIDFCNISLTVSLISLQVYQIDNNVRRGIDEIADNPFVFLIPYFLLILALIILLLISISLVISLQEYKSYLRTRNKELIVHRKLDFDKIFENKNRQKIIRVILSNPGIHFKELLRECYLQSGQLRWHLKVLEEFKIIKKKSIGQYKSYFSRIENMDLDKYNKVLIKSKLRIQILYLIEKNPGIIPSTIANKLELKKTTLNYHIYKLKNNNLIKTQKVGHNLNLFLIRE